MDGESKTRERVSHVSVQTFSYKSLCLRKHSLQVEHVHPKASILSFLWDNHLVGPHVMNTFFWVEGGRGWDLCPITFTCCRGVKCWCFHISRPQQHQLVGRPTPLLATFFFEGNQSHSFLETGLSPAQNKTRYLQDCCFSGIYNSSNTNSNFPLQSLLQLMMIYVMQHYYLYMTP